METAPTTTETTDAHPNRILQIGLVVITLLTLGGIAFVFYPKKKEEEVVDETAAEKKKKDELAAATKQAEEDAASHTTPTATQTTDGVIRFGGLDHIWEYRKDHVNIWWTRKKGNTTWISLQTNKVATDLLNKKYPKG